MKKNAKVLFAIPPERYHLYREIGNEPTMHMGLAYVATYLASCLPVEVRLVDAPVERMGTKEFCRLVEEYRPLILAMTAYTFQIKDAAWIAEQVKKRLPDLQIVIGGYHVNAIPSRTLKEFPVFDTAVFGEGEQTAVELVKQIQTGGGGGRDGTAYRNKDEVVVNPGRAFIEDLADIPYPDFSLFRMNRYANTVDPPSMFWLRCVPIYINRGCPYKCKFCLRSFGNRVRYRELEHVMGEIERDIFDYRANRLLIMDETFTVNRESTIRFTDEMTRRAFHKKLKWFCQTRVDLVDEELLKRLKLSGCRYMNFGIESGSEEQLKAVDKKVVLHQARKVVGEAMRLGMRVQCGFIFGLPGETVETAKETIETSIRIDPSVATFSILTPFPGTKIYEMARRGEGGLKLLTEDWSQYGKQVARGALELENLPFKQLLSLQNLAYRRFYLRPKKILNIFLFVSPAKILRYLVGYLLQMQKRKRSV